MATHLVLLCAAGTKMARNGGFASPDEPLDAGGKAKARTLALSGPIATECWSSPALAARDTAATLAFDAAAEPVLRDIDHGLWTGQSLEAVAQSDAPGLTAWLAAPHAGTPGGETMAQVVARVTPWLEGLQEGNRRVLAITHAAVIRAVIAVAIDMPVVVTMAIDIAPLSTVVLSFHGRWRLQELRRA